MTFETALRLIELLLGFAVLQQSAELFIAGGRDRALAALRMALCLLLWSGLASAVAICGLWVTSLALLLRFNGPYNGGSDKMTVLVLTCTALAHIAPAQHWRDLALAYLAVQLVLSYFVSGWIKVINAEWRSGRALVDVFAYSAYPVSGELRSWAQRPRALWAASWGVMTLEVIFPLLLVHPLTLVVGLCLAAGFHLSNACVFGLNRFFWIWISAYPALIWFQARIFGG